jgi:hypothetical protein
LENNLVYHKIEHPSFSSLWVFLRLLLNLDFDVLYFELSLEVKRDQVLLHS